MGFQPKIAIIQSKSTGIIVKDDTGNYDAVTNPTGFGAPNPTSASITAILVAQAVLGKPLPSVCSVLTSPQKTSYLNGTGIATSSDILMDGVYDVHVLLGYAGPAQLSATQNSSQFTLTNASVVFEQAVGFSLSADPTKVYRIDRTRPLTITGGYATESIPNVTNDNITIYYEGNVDALVYDQGQACLATDIANSDISCDCDEDLDALMARYARYLSMLYKFSTTKDYQGAHKLAVGLQTDCNKCGIATTVAAASATGVPPTILTNPSNATVNVGQNASFSVVASGSAPLSYQWKKDGVAITGANSDTLNLFNIQNSDAGSYSVVVWNAFGNAVSSPATLTVTTANIPITITLQPQSQVGAAGGNVTFSVAATGTAPITYQWRKNGTPIGGATNSTLTLTGISAPDAANYDCVLTNPAGSVTSNVATLTLGVTALWGWRSTVPTVLADITGLQSGGAFTPGGTITADFRANSTPMYLVMAEPSTEPAKTKWYATSDNQGNIGDPDTDLFGVPVIIGSYRVYVTVYKTFNTANPIEFRVS